MTIFALCHTKVKPFKNPLGPHYDRFQPDMHEKTWGLSHKWADAVLFGNFESGSLSKGFGDAVAGGVPAPVTMKPVWITVLPGLIPSP